MSISPNRRVHKNFRPRRFSVNFPLWTGALLVTAIAYLAVIGPYIAPKDPLEENLIVRDELTGEWHIPPFEAFSVTGFPLGSDEFGRDLYSRLLFAIRPTLQMVMIVAGVRLVLGTLIGLVAGYSTGRLGKIFDSLISSALAIPGLLVALGAIAIVGVELGVFAFIIGLSITGWAETARLVREQTRSIRNEVYVEAAQALGATDPQIVFRHVLRQIRAMLLMLFAFEVGSTLMLTAGLGFLGYYIGGDVWVDVDDFVARRTSGAPELGQMLATAWVRLTDPWGLVSVGTVVFGSVLGFNLIGEGLRLRLNPESRAGRLRWVSNGLAWLRLNIEQAWHPVGSFLFGTRTAVTLWLLFLGVGVGYGLTWSWQQGFFDLPEPEVNLFFEDSQQDSAPTPTGVSTTIDASREENEGLRQPLVISAEPLDPQDSVVPDSIIATVSGWVYKAPARLEIDPLIHENGSIYLLTEENIFYVLDPQGNRSETLPLPEPVYTFEEQVWGGGTVRTPFPPLLAPSGAVIVVSETRLYALGLDNEIMWEIALDAAPYSPPIIGPEGETYYLLDREGSLYVYTPENGLKWKHDLEEGFKPAYAFPVISQEGDVFYSITNGTRGQIEALSANGEQRWRTMLTTFNFYRPIQITPMGDWISLDDNVVRTDTGELVELSETEFKIDQFVMGQDGETYLLSGNTVMEWSLAAGGRLSIERQQTVAFPSNVSTGLPPRLTVTRDGTIWFTFFGARGSLFLYLWADFDGSVSNIIRADMRQGFVLSEDYENIRLAYCGIERAETLLTCVGYEKGVQEPVWEVVIQGIQRADSIQYREGLLYIQTQADTVQIVHVDLPIE